MEGADEWEFLLPRDPLSGLAPCDLSPTIEFDPCRAYAGTIVSGLMNSGNTIVLDYDFENSIGFWVMTAAQDYERAINDELAPQGITYRQCQVLGCLSLYGPLAQAELAEKMRIEPPTLVGILDRMERDKWIRRVPCPGDRRKKLIQPLAAAKPVWAKIIVCAKRVRSQATQGLSSTELATLRRLLGKVKSNLKLKSSDREAG